MWRKILGVTLAAVLVVGAGVTPKATAESIQRPFYVDGKAWNSRPWPKVINQTLMFPLAGLSSLVGIEVLWDEEGTGKFTLRRGSTVAHLETGKQRAVVDGGPTTLAQPPIFQDGVTWIPRQVLELMQLRLTDGVEDSPPPTGGDIECDRFERSAPTLYSKKLVEWVEPVRDAPTGRWLGRLVGQRSADAVVDTKIVELLLSAVPSKPAFRDSDGRTLQPGSAVQTPDVPDPVVPAVLGRTGLWVATEFFECGSIIWPQLEVHRGTASDLRGGITIEVADQSGRTHLKPTKPIVLKRPVLSQSCGDDCGYWWYEPVFVSRSERITNAVASVIPWTSDATGYNGPDCSLAKEIVTAFKALFGHEDNCWPVINFTDLVRAPIWRTVLFTLESKTAHVDGEALTLDAAPYIKAGRTMVPLRFIAEAFGMDVAWDGNWITITGHSHTVKLAPGSIEATVDGRQHYLDATPEVIANRTFVPVRFVAEAFGLKITWDDGRVIVKGGVPAKDGTTLLAAP